jgi:hypothetical protein
VNPLVPSPSTRHWAIRLTVAFVLCGITACIIGPKQDDPETTAAVEQDSGTSALDTGVFDQADTGRGGPPDASSMPGEETGALTDGAVDAPKPADSGCADGGDASDAACDSGGADAVSGG